MHPPSLTGTVNAADELFVNLDSTEFTAGPSTWLVEVCGIHISAARCWVQLNLIGDESYSVTVAPPAPSVPAVRQCLSAWASRRDLAANPAAMDVAPAHSPVTSPRT